MYVRKETSVCNNFIKENFDEKIQNSLCSMPKEVFREVFFHLNLNLATIGKICCINKEWKQLAIDSHLWKRAIYREIAIGKDKWAQFFGQEIVKGVDNEEEFSSLPWNDFIEDCKKIKSVFPEKRVKDCLMLVRISNIFHLNILGTLAKKYFPNNNKGYRAIQDSIINVLGDQSIDKSCWVLMTDILPESRNKSYDEQTKIVANLTQKDLIGYEIPKTLEAVACILAHYFDSGTRLFSDKPWTYTRCQERLPQLRVVVGGFTPDGLHIYLNHNYNDGIIGVAAIRKFYR